MKYKKEVLKLSKELIKISSNKNYVVLKATRGPTKPTRIPLKISEELSFFVAAIIGDGHIRRLKLQINFEVNEKNLVEYIQKICKKLFNRQFNLHKRTENHKGIRDRYSIVIDSKAICLLLNKVFKVPRGKKSNIVKVSQHIKKSNKSIKRAFLLGIMATEGGNRRRGYGLSTSSKVLWKDLINLFEEVGINVKTDKWVHKKYKKEYYGISFKKEDFNLLSGSARVVKWSTFRSNKFIE